MLCLNMFDGFRFQRCCENALNAAVKLVAWASDCDAKELEADYRKSCKNNDDPFTYADVPVAEDEQEEFLSSGIDPFGDPSDQVLPALTQLQAETIFVDPEGSDGENPIFSDQPGQADEDLEKLLQVEVEQPEPEFLPGTLQDALATRGCTWNALFRFVVRLRHGPGGCDLPWVPNARGTRRVSSKLNWHQHLGSAWDICICLFPFCIFWYYTTILYVWCIIYIYIYISI